MESKWYFFPGQTTENTRISDRAHALHITSAAWNNITQHQYRTQRIQEAIEKEKAHREALKKGSEEMSKEWANSIANIHQRKEEERRQRINQKKEDKIQMFYKLREEQEVIRKQYVEKAQKQAYMESGRSKQLNGALILSETLYEREKQIEFNEQCRKHEEEIKHKLGQEIIALDEKQRQEDKEKKQKKREEERKIAEILKRQIEESEETQKATNLALIQKETEDRIKAAEEQELLKQFELEEKKRKQRQMAQEKKKAIVAERKRQEILAKENAEMEKATEFYSAAKHRIDCLLKSKAKAMRDEALKKREQLALKVAAIQQAKEGVENERIAKVVAETEALEKLKYEEKAAAKAQTLKDRNEDRKQYLERLENEKRVENEMKRWELLNQCKAREAVKEYDEQHRREKWAKMMEYRKDLLQQMIDDNEAKKTEKEIDDILSHVSFEDADKMFFEYANEVLELAKRKNRPTYPIEKVITEYKKMYNLIPITRGCSHKKH